MTSRYLADVMAAAPTGPVRLAGFCHGGLAALEVARRLEGVGRTVETVILIDTYSLNARPVMRSIVPFVSWVGRALPGNWGRKVRRSGMPSVWVLASHILGRDRAILKRVTRTARNGSMRVWDSTRRSTHFRAMSRYLPPRIGAELICLVCEEYSVKKEYDTAVWKSLAAKVRQARIPGQHQTCISIHVDGLCERLNEVLAEPPIERAMLTK
jgi:hypothetical protein